MVRVPPVALVTVRMRCSRGTAPARVQFVASTAEETAGGSLALRVRRTVQPTAVLELLVPLNVPIEMLASGEPGSVAAWSGVVTGETTIELDLASAVVHGLVVDDTGEPMRSFELTGAILSPLGAC